MLKENEAILVLEDGSVFKGKSFGAHKTVVGEAVFNTGITGYQEVLTDPSYYQQIVTMTAPQIGNYGINPEDNESDSPKVTGFVVQELSPITSNWRSQEDLHSYLKRYKIPAIEGVDTRSITMKVRKTGAMKACLSTEPGMTTQNALEQARNWPGLESVDLVKAVTCKKPYSFEMPQGGLPKWFHPKEKNKPYHVAVFDFGIKKSILLHLLAQGFRITVLPAYTNSEQVSELNPQAIFLSNGPGDPAAVTYAHQTIKELLGKYPIFGICMGHQIITHALGAHTYKLKFGHRGSNQPVKNLETGSVSITTQNHGYAVNFEALEEKNAVVTEINLNDNTVSGLKHKNYPVFSVQYHPEAAPGPNDAAHLFERFYEMVDNYHNSK